MTELVEARVARLEERSRHVDDTLDDMKRKVDEMYGLLTQGKGATKALRLIWLVGGALLASFGGWLISHIPGLGGR